MPIKRNKGKIYKVDPDTLRDYVVKSKNWAQLGKKIGYASGSRHLMEPRLKELGIDYSHIPTPQQSDNLPKGYSYRPMNKVWGISSEKFKKNY